MDQSTTSPTTASPAHPTKEELNAELLPVPELPEPPPAPDPPGTDAIIAQAVGYIRGKRGGDLVAIILVGSCARRAMTKHSDLDFIALVKGYAEGQEILRIADRLIDIRYRGVEAVEEELRHAVRLPPLLRKGRVLFEHEGAGSKIIEKAQQRFRQGPPSASLAEKIRMKADCQHWLGKAEDMANANDPATAQYLLSILLEELLQAFLRLKNLWPTAPADMLHFAASRDLAVGDLFERLAGAPALPPRFDAARQLMQALFKDVPNPQRLD